ncbi:ABC transporter permease subunit [Bacillus sp. REN16]|uniref:ABC transporter permease subunit n=1 Tax=Bacillus sp. REN16 TaxID=2887296 RepID=UPI001E420855|nr:ABC transporter permease subunit [Bacillus sp. REN16]MCC3358619.1 ABC transporter permease subunit [Bacillus sp. REN16]
MFNKALWLRNYKQSKFVVWALWLVCLYFPYKLNNFLSIEEYSLLHWDEWGNSDPYALYFGNFLEVGLFQVLAAILLATSLIGLERTNQSLDFTLALPYKRSDIFFSKWIFGVFHLALALGVSVVISMIILGNSVLNEYLSLGALGYYFLLALATLTGVYTFSLFIGLIGASYVSQLAFSLIFLFLPYGLYNLVIKGIAQHYIAITGNSFIKENFGIQKFDNFVESLSFPLLLMDFERDINEIFVWKQAGFLSSLSVIIIPIIVTFISLYLIKRLSPRFKSENNGKVLAYEELFPYLKAGVFICFYLLGGMVIGSSLAYKELPSLLSYHLGGLGFGIIAYFVLTKLAGARMQFGKK